MYCEYPILKETDNDYDFPNGEHITTCPICGADFRTTGWMGFSAGAIQVDKKGDAVHVKKEEPHKAYCYLSFHGIPMPVGEEWMSLDIVKHIAGSGFRFHFCSIECLRIGVDRFLSDFETLFEAKYKRKLSKPN